MNYELLTSVMRELAIEAGNEIIKIYNSEDFDIEVKSDNSLVTAADKAADEVISVGLCTAFPDVALVTEEQSASHSTCAEAFLIVDPLDGTKEFIHRRGDFTVNIAFIENGVPTRGIVYAPAKGHLFYTQADGSSVEELSGFSNSQATKLTPIRVKAADNDSLLVVASKSHRDNETDAYIQKYSVTDMKSVGSSLKFCLIAAGRADLYPRLGRTMEWDTAAGHAVLKGAGGAVVRFDDLQPLAYGKPGDENPFFIAHGHGVALKSN